MICRPHGERVRGVCVFQVAEKLKWVGGVLPPWLSTACNRSEGYAN